MNRRMVKATRRENPKMFNFYYNQHLSRRMEFFSKNPSAVAVTGMN